MKVVWKEIELSNYNYIENNLDIGPAISQQILLQLNKNIKFGRVFALCQENVSNERLLKFDEGIMFNESDIFSEIVPNGANSFLEKSLDEHKSC